MSRYVQDPNDVHKRKQISGPLPDNAYDRAIPATITGSLVKTPNSILIGNVTGDVGFFFGSSASFAALSTTETNTDGTEGGTYLTGSNNYTNFGTPAAGTVLNIHPSAWSGSSADNDNNAIIFLYKGAK